MTISAYTFKLNAGLGVHINDVDTVVVMASTAADALALLESHYPNVPKGVWDAVATPTAEAAAADWNGWRWTVVVTPIAAGRTAVSGKTYTFSYTAVVAKTSDQMALGLAAAMALVEPFANTTDAGAGVLTMSATDAVGDAVVTSRVEYVGDLGTLDAATNPRAYDNLQPIVGIAPTVQAAQAHGAARTVTMAAVTNIPRVVGFFKSRAGV